LALRKADTRAGVPGWLVAPAVVAAAFILIPIVSLVPSVDWGNFVGLVTSESSRAALVLSLETALATTILCLVVGVPLAVVLARLEFRGRRALRTAVLLPLVLPPVVGGIALLQAFGRRGLLGRYLDPLGIQIAFTTVAVVMSQMFVSLPFLVISLEGALRSSERDLETMAATLGANPTRVFTRVVMPSVAPSLASGAVLAFARALGEFGATLTFAGSLQGRTRTLPLEIYLQREVDPDAAVALSLVLVVVAAAVVASVYGRELSR